MEMPEVRQAALVRLARINMDQAIQITTSWVKAIDGTIIKTEKELPRKREQ